MLTFQNMKKISNAIMALPKVKIDSKSEDWDWNRYGFQFPMEKTTKNDENRIKLKYRFILEMLSCIEIPGRELTYISPDKDYNIGYIDISVIGLYLLAHYPYFYHFENNVFDPLLTNNRDKDETKIGVLFIDWLRNIGVFDDDAFIPIRIWRRPLF